MDHQVGFLLILSVCFRPRHAFTIGGSECGV